MMVKSKGKSHLPRTHSNSKSRCAVPYDMASLKFPTRQQVLHFNPSTNPPSSRYQLQIWPQYQPPPPPLMQQPQLQQQVQVYQYHHQQPQFTSTNQPMHLPPSTSLYFQHTDPSSNEFHRHQYPQQVRFPPCPVQNSHSALSLLSQYSGHNGPPSVRHSAADRQFLDNYSHNMPPHHHVSAFTFRDSNNGLNIPSTYQVLQPVCLSRSGHQNIPQQHQNYRHNSVIQAANYGQSNEQMCFQPSSHHPRVHNVQESSSMRNFQPTLAPQPVGSGRGLMRAASGFNSDPNASSVPASRRKSEVATTPSYHQLKRTKSKKRSRGLLSQKLNSHLSKKRENIKLCEAVSLHILKTKACFPASSSASQQTLTSPSKPIRILKKGEDILLQDDSTPEERPSSVSSSSTDHNIEKTNKKEEPLRIDKPPKTTPRKPPSAIEISSSSGDSEDEVPDPSSYVRSSNPLCPTIQPYRTPMATLLLSQVQECMKDELVSKKSLKNIPCDIPPEDSDSDDCDTLQDDQSYYDRHDPYKQGGIYVGKNGEVFYSMKGTSSERVRYEEANEVEPLEVGFVACEPDPPYPEDPDSIRFWNGFLNLSEIANQKLLDFIAWSLEHDDKWDMFTHLEIILKHGGVASTVQSVYSDFENHYSPTESMLLFFEFLSGIFTPYSAGWSRPNEREDPLILEIEYDVANLDKGVFHCVEAEEATEEVVNVVTLLRQSYLEDVGVGIGDLRPVGGKLSRGVEFHSRGLIPEAEIGLDGDVEVCEVEDEDDLEEDLVEVVQELQEDSEPSLNDEEPFLEPSVGVNSDTPETPSLEESTHEKETKSKERTLEPWELKVKTLLGGYAEPGDWETEEDVLFPKRNPTSSFLNEPSCDGMTTSEDDANTHYIRMLDEFSSHEISFESDVSFPSGFSFDSEPPEVETSFREEMPNLPREPDDDLVLNCSDTCCCSSCNCSGSSSPISRCDLSFYGSSDNSWETVDVEIVDSDHSSYSEETTQLKKLNDGILRAKVAWDNAIVS